LPNDGQEPGWAFFHVARGASWQDFGDWSAAWCSLKLILACVALFLILDSLGTLLMRVGWKTLGQYTFYFILVPSLGLMLGIYYLLKALL
jgi:hypothetical protein